jgi:hypothetical protein
MRLAGGRCGGKARSRLHGSKARQTHVDGAQIALSVYARIGLTKDPGPTGRPARSGGNAATLGPLRSQRSRAVSLHQKWSTSAQSGRAAAISPCGAALDGGTAGRRSRPVKASSRGGLIAGWLICTRRGYPGRCRSPMRGRRVPRLGLLSRWRSVRDRSFPVRSVDGFRSLALVARHPVPRQMSGLRRVVRLRRPSNCRVRSDSCTGDRL